MRTPSHAPQLTTFIPSTFVSLPPLLLSSTSPTPSSTSHLTLPIGLAASPQLVGLQTVALVDCGATESFVSSSFVAQHRLSTSPLTVPRILRVIDGREIESGLVTHVTTQIMTVGDHSESIYLLICTLRDYDVVLGTPWLQKHDPSISWSSGTVSFTSPYCSLNCSASNSTFEGRLGEAEDAISPVTPPHDHSPSSPTGPSQPACEVIDQDGLYRLAKDDDLQVYAICFSALLSSDVTAPLSACSLTACSLSSATDGSITEILPPQSVVIPLST